MKFEICPLFTILLKRYDAFKRNFDSYFIKNVFERVTQSDKIQHQHPSGESNITTSDKIQAHLITIRGDIGKKTLENYLILSESEEKFIVTATKAFYLEESSLYVVFYKVKSETDSDKDQELLREVNLFQNAYIIMDKSG
jgi:hypothetical protein